MPWIPDNFLRTCAEPEPDDFNFLSFPPVPFLVVCLYGFPNFIPDFIEHLENDSNNPGPDKEAKAQVAVEALVQISNQIRASGKNLQSYFAAKHGESEIPKGGGLVPNPPYHAEKFAVTKLVGFDPIKRTFVRYNPANGLWEYSAIEDLRRLASSYWKEFADTKSSEAAVRGKLLAMRTTGFLDSFLKLSASFSNFFPSTAPPVLLHAKNKMVGIGRKEANREFSPVFFSQSQIPVAYFEKGKSAECPKFTEFLAGALEEDDIKLLQKWAGAVIMGVNHFQKILLVTGVGGAGKSVFALILEGVIGPENCIELRAANLGDRFEQGRFINKKLLLGLDVPLDFLSSPGAAHLKKLTGKDSISPELKGSKSIPRIKGVFNVLITSNVRPRLRLQADREAWERRLMHLEFKKLKTRKKMDREFAENLLKEEASGILRWMVAGARDIRQLMNNKTDWKLTSTQEDRVSAILNEAESLRAFLNVKVEEVKVMLGVKAPPATLTTQEIYDAYTLYCDCQNWIPLTFGQANRALPSLMIEIYKSNPRTDIKRRKKTGKEGNQRGYARVRFKGSTTPKNSETSV